MYRNPPNLSIKAQSLQKTAYSFNFKLNDWFSIFPIVHCYLFCTLADLRY